MPEGAMHTERVAVVSSHLATVGYDEEARTLEVETKRGRRYRYTGVPPAIFRELMGASSKGRYYLRNIRSVFPRQEL
jgi:hypothetical protein